jgi:N-carbamoylputrescine amidase
MASTLGNITANLDRASALSEEAAAQGAQIILFPELMPSGYSTNEQVWQSAEPADGVTAKWVIATSGRLRVYIGTSFIEAKGGHFINTFILGSPDGSEAGRIFKEHAETYIFHSQPGSRVIETQLGCIGVGICADNQYANHPRLLQQQNADLVLMPHAWSMPWRVSKVVSEADIQRQQEHGRGLAAYYARLLGIPAIFVNQVGPTAHLKGRGFVGGLMDSEDYAFSGLTTIADSDGTVLAQLGSDEGIAVADVTLDPARKSREAIPHYGQWATPGSISRDILFGIDGTMGKLWYSLNSQRGMLARLRATER